MSKFSISDGMLNGLSKNVKKANELEAKDTFSVQYIDINNIQRNEKNFYKIVDVDDLAEDIKMNGLNHNLVVRQLENGTYELISGERRFTALTKLVNDGDSIFALVPCKVVDKNDIDSEIILIQANAQTRELSESEKLKQVERLSELYKTKKANGEKVPGKVRDIIANDLKLSPTQVGRYDRINNKLIPSLKSLLEQGNLTIANASEFSTLSEENQKVILDIINNKVEISKEEATTLKSKLKKIEEEKIIEIKNKQVIIDENNLLKSKLQKDNLKSDEEIKQIEGQLRVELKNELDNKYSLQIEEVKNEAIKSKNEKDKLKKELAELKATAPKENIEEVKSNYALLCELRNVHNSLLSISRQHKSMQEKNIPVSSDIVECLNKAINMSYTLNALKNILK